jgi:hypothetical protein
MNWRIEWSRAALATLRSNHWKEQARIDAAVQRLAATGEGDLVSSATDPVDACLRLPPYRIYLSFNRFDGLLWVRYVYRTR